MRDNSERPFPSSPARHVEFQQDPRPAHDFDQNIQSELPSIDYTVNKYPKQSEVDVTAIRIEEEGPADNAGDDGSITDLEDHEHIIAFRDGGRTDTDSTLVESEGDASAKDQIITKIVVPYDEPR